MNPGRQLLPYSNIREWSNDSREIIEAFSQLQNQDTGSIYIKIDPVQTTNGQRLHPPKTICQIEDSNTAINRITQEANIKREINQNSLISGLEKIKSDAMIEIQAIRNNYNFKNHQLEKNVELQKFQMDIQLKAHQAFLNRDLERLKLEAAKSIEELNHNLQMEFHRSELLVKDAQNRLEYEIKMIEINNNRELEEVIERNSKEIALKEHETDKIIEAYKQKISIEIEQAKSKANIEVRRIECETAVEVAKIESKGRMWGLVAGFVFGVAKSFIPGMQIFDLIPNKFSIL